MVVGGYALAFHGYVRATGDIDLWIRISEENAEKGWNALRKLGAPLSDLSKEDLKTPGMVYQMGLPPNRIDIINEIEGVEFEIAWQERNSIEFEGLTIPLLGKNELLANKRAMNRPKDKGDIFWLESNP